MMRAVQIKVGQDMEVVDIPNELEALQKVVGGYLEQVSLTETMAMLINEDGLRLRLRPNRVASALATLYFRALGGIVGDVLVVGFDAATGELTDLATCPCCNEPWPGGQKASLGPVTPPQGHHVN